ncbi:hypothetical protein ACLD02_06280 [Alloalcanivorax sp. C16-2]|uniref:hypothetical protein n=1 Tax=Alloalcanivorax sp. C16-2 TaxID=3390052 RepID=UPI003970A7BD
MLRQGRTLRLKNRDGPSNGELLAGLESAGPDQPHPEEREAVLADEGGDWALPGFL